MQSPFCAGDSVTWAIGAPATWRFIWTPGPMKVVSSYWHDGSPTEYEQRFTEMFGGKPRVPGWIVTVEYDADSSDYRDPPLSLLLGVEKVQMEVHEMWLVLVTRS